MENHSTTILVVGSGITGLMTAYEAATRGHKVKIVSKSPDPRAGGTSRYHSSTWDGYANRYITLTEGHPYFDLSGYISTMYPGVHEDFQQEVSSGGMLSLPKEEFNALSQKFLEERAEANEDKEGILALFYTYIDENRASMQMWYKMLTGAVQRYPEMITGTSMHTQGIDRFYDERKLCKSACATQSDEGIVKTMHSEQDILEDVSLQIYRDGLRNNGFISGGGLTIFGLALDIRALCLEWLFKELEEKRVEMLFGAEYEVIEVVRSKDNSNRVAGIRTMCGTVHSAKHIFLHPGAYMKPEVLEGTGAHGKLAGVKGLWMRIKNAQDLLNIKSPPRPNKIHGGRYEVAVRGSKYTGQICDLNVMPKIHADGTWELVIGSGYIFVGTYDDDTYEESYENIGFSEELAIRAFAQIVSKIYDIPIDCDKVLKGTHEYIDLPSKGCVRSFTPDDKELRVIIPTQGGGILVIDGGGNTGSTTKAPFISATGVNFIESIDQTGMGEQKEIEERYEETRAQLRKSRQQLGKEDWQRLEDDLNDAIQKSARTGLKQPKMYLPK